MRRILLILVFLIPFGTIHSIELKKVTKIKIIKSIPKTSLNEIKYYDVKLFPNPCVDFINLELTPYEKIKKVYIFSKRNQEIVFDHHQIEHTRKGVKSIYME